MGSENQTGLYALPPDPELADLYRVWARKIGLAIRTAVPGTVMAYDPTTQEASIRVDFLQVQRVTQQVAGEPDPSETNKERASAPLLLTKVPVCWAGAGDGESYLTFPITAGCTGTLVVLDRSKDTWVNRTASVAVDPVKSAIHSLADCVFFPGLTDRAHRISTPTDLTAAVLEHPTAIKLGRNASSKIVKAELLDALDAFANAVPVPNDGGAAIQAAFKAVYTIIRPTLETIKVNAE